MVFTITTSFGRCLRPSSGALDCIYSFWYCPPILLPDKMELPWKFHPIHDTSRRKYRWTISEAVNTVKCSWWWAKTAWNMQSWLGINKSAKIGSSILSMTPAGGSSMDNIRSCKHSQVHLMMGEDIAWNMQSWLGINKSAKIGSSILSMTPAGGSIGGQYQKL